MDGPRFAARLLELDAAYDPSVSAVQLNLLGSHDAPRVRSVLGGDVEAVRLAKLLQATLPGAPCVYYGDEVGLAGGIDPDSRRAFPWDDAHWEPGLRDFVRTVLHARAAEPALRRGSLQVLAAEDSAVAIERRLDGGRCVVLVNAGRAPANLRLGWDTGRPVVVEPIVTSGAPVVVTPADDGSIACELPARSGSLVRIR
jgi:neopullulanase